MCKRRKVVINDDAETEVEVWQPEEQTSSASGDGENNCCCCCVCCNSCSSLTLERIKVVLLLLGVVLGVSMGVGLWYVPVFHDEMLGTRMLMYLKLPAVLITNLTTLMAIPIAITSLISGISALRANAVARIGLHTLLYQFCTCTIALVECISAYYIMHIIVGDSWDGSSSSNDTNQSQEDAPTLDISSTALNVSDFFIDVLRNFFPSNLAEAWFTLERTNVTRTEIVENNETAYRETFSTTKVPGSNYIGLVIISVLFALVTTFQPSSVQQVIQQLFNALFQVAMSIIQAILWIYPVCLISLLACEVCQTPLSSITQLTSLVIYCLTAFTVMVIHFIFILPVIYLIFTRKNPFRHMFNMSRALFVAFATGSSSIALPTSISCLDRAGIRRVISRFVIPVGMNLNLDGTALCQPLMVLFVLQHMDIQLGILQTIILTFMVVSVTFAAPSLGSSAYVTLAMCLGIPVQQFTSVIAVAWLMTRLRTVVSVWSDLVACAVLERLSLKVLLQRTSSLPRPSRGALSPGDVQLIGARGVLPDRKHYTLTVENESGEKIKVSKV